jgi:hypothetical protein
MKYRIKWRARDGREYTRVIGPEGKIKDPASAKNKIIADGGSDFEYWQVDGDTPITKGEAAPFSPATHVRPVSAPTAAPALPSVDPQREAINAEINRANDPRQVVGGGFLRGLTLDWADELSANTPAARKRAELEKQESPWLSMGGEILGGIPMYAAGAAYGAKLGARGGPYGALIGGALGAGAVGALEAGGAAESASLGDTLEGAGIAAAMQVIGGMPVKKGAAVIKKLLGITDEVSAAKKSGVLDTVRKKATEATEAKAQLAAAEKAREEAYDAATQQSMSKMEIPLNSPVAKRATEAMQKEVAARAKEIEAQAAQRSLENIEGKILADAAQEGMAATAIAPAITSALPSTGANEDERRRLAQDIISAERRARPFSYPHAGGLRKMGPSKPATENASVDTRPFTGMQPDAADFLMKEIDALQKEIKEIDFLMPGRQGEGTELRRRRIGLEKRLIQRLSELDSIVE